jgi:hypothetical protein
MAILADNPSDLIDQMILLTKRLTHIAELQSNMFDTSKVDEYAKLNDEASRLAATYTIESARIARNPALLAQIDPHLKENFKKETKKFRDILAAHEQAIERAKNLTEGLVKAIAHEAANARPTPQAYSPSLRGIDGPRRDTSAIALDRRA